MKTSRTRAATLAALAFGLWAGSAQAVAGQVTTVAIQPRADETAVVYRQALTDELLTQISSFRALLMGTSPSESAMAKSSAAIMTTALMLRSLSPRISGGVETYPPEAQALVAATERLDEAARAGDRSVVAGHLLTVVRAFGAFQADLPAPPARRPVETTVNID